MATRLVEGKKPYTGGKAIEITKDKVINLKLRDENNLIIYDDGDNEIYVDLQLPNEVEPTDAFPVGVNVGRVIVDNGWDKAGTLISAKTTSGDNIKLLYADDGTLWIDNGTGTFKQIYFKADVDLLISTLTTYINTELAKKQNGVTSGTAPSNPSEGDLWYDTTSNSMKVYDGTNWNAVGTGGGGSDIVYATQAEYNALLPGALTDNKHYFIYTKSGPIPPTPGSRLTITGFTYDNETLSVPQSTYGDVNGITWKPDGTKFYITGEQNNRVYQYSVSTPRDVTTATYDNKNVATTLNVSNSIIFSDDGLTMWIGGGWSDGYVYKWILSTAWDVSTATYVGDSTGKSNISFYGATGYWITNNGQYLYVLSREILRIRRYTMLTPRDITTLDVTYQEYNITNGCHKVQLNPQGTQLFYYDRDNRKIHICALSTPFDLTTISETSQYTITTPSSPDITSVTIDNEGNSMWIGGWQLNNIYVYSTTTA